MAALLSTALLATALLGCATPQESTRPAPADPAALPPAVALALQHAGVGSGALAAVVLPLSPPGPAWLHQADRAMQPGSTMKLLTSIVALDRLGPNHRGFTELLSAAPQRGDVLAGELVLRGGADPELGLPQLWAMLAELRHTHGIREIAGDIVVDRTLFRPQRRDLGLPPFDEHPEFPYNVIPDALQIGGGLMRLEISSEGGSAVQARALPPLPGLQIDTSAMRLTDRPCRDWDKDWISPPGVDETVPGSLRVRLQGGFPKACTQRPSLQLIDRLALLERQLRWLWTGLGGQWSGRAREAETPSIAPQSAAPPGLRLLARRVARPWGELLHTMNKQSDNPTTRTLYLSLGLAGMADAPGADTAELAGREVRRWFDQQGIDSTGLVLDNGSGLSRSERITPRQLAWMLRAAQQGAWAAELMASLPVAGIDGTMRNRLKTGPATGRARLKTGTLRNVAALAGYVPDTQGRWWVLVAMVNDDKAAAARPALDALVDWVAAGGVAPR